MSYVPVVEDVYDDSSSTTSSSDDDDENDEDDQDDDNVFEATLHTLHAFKEFRKERRFKWGTPLEHRSKSAARAQRTAEAASAPRMQRRV
jgi:hypothetical protein